MVEAGAVLVSYSISCINPDGAKNVYKGLNLYNLRQSEFWHYTLSVSFMIALSCMKAFVSFLAIKILSKVNLENSFKIEVARILEKMSYVLLTAWIIAMLNNAHTGWLLKKTG